MINIHTNKKGKKVLKQIFDGRIARFNTISADYHIITLADEEPEQTAQLQRVEQYKINYIAAVNSVELGKAIIHSNILLSGEVVDALRERGYKAANYQGYIEFTA